MIRRELHGEVVLLSMAHGKANVLDVELLLDLTQTLEALEREDPLAVVLASDVKGIFSAGVDLKHLLDGGPDYVDRFLPALDDLLRRLFAFHRPVVAAIGGHAIAGGCLLAAACDLRVMGTEVGRIGVPELAVGVPFPPMGLEILRFVVPRRCLQEVAYEGRTYPPEEARERGLIDRLVEPEAVLETALSAARRFGLCPRRSFELTKKLLRQPALEQAKKAEGLHGAAIAEVWRSDEARAAITRYVARTLRSG